MQAGGLESAASQKLQEVEQKPAAAEQPEEPPPPSKRQKRTPGVTVLGPSTRLPPSRLSSLQETAASANGMAGNKDVARSTADQASKIAAARSESAVPAVSQAPPVHPIPARMPSSQASGRGSKPAASDALSAKAQGTLQATRPEQSDPTEGAAVVAAAAAASGSAPIEAAPSSSHAAWPSRTAIEFLPTKSRSTTGSNVQPASQAVPAGGSSVQAALMSERPGRAQATADRAHNEAVLAEAAMSSEGLARLLQEQEYKNAQGGGARGR